MNLNPTQSSTGKAPRKAFSAVLAFLSFLPCHHFYSQSGPNSYWTRSFPTEWRRDPSTSSSQPHNPRYCINSVMVLSRKSKLEALRTFSSSECLSEFHICACNGRNPGRSCYRGGPGNARHKGSETRNRDPKDRYRHWTRSSSGAKKSEFESWNWYFAAVWVGKGGRDPVWR